MGVDSYSLAQVAAAHETAHRDALIIAESSMPGGMHSLYRYAVTHEGGVTSELVYSFERSEGLNGILVAD